MKSGKMVFLMLALLLVFISGCSENKANNDTGAKGNQNSEQPDVKTPEVKAPEVKKTEPPKPVELTFHATPTSWTEEFFMNKMGKFITEKFPHVKVKFLPTYVIDGKVINANEYLAIGEKIDVLIDSVGATKIFDTAMELDLTDLIKKHNYDLGALEPNTVQIQKNIGKAGKVYGLPFETQTLVLNYNNDLFDKFGISPPTNNSTWDDIFDLTKRMSRTEGDVNYRGFTSSYAHMFIMSQLSVPRQDPTTFKSLFQSDAFKREMEFVTAPYLIAGNGWDHNPGSSELAYELTNGIAAMYVGLDVAWSVFEFDKVNFDTIRLPARKEAPDMGPQTYPWYMYVTSMSKDPDTAFKVVSYFTSPEYQTWNARQGNLPILKNSSDIMKQYNDDMPGYKGKNKDILWGKLAPPPEITKYNGNALNYSYNMFYQIIVEHKDINTVLREAAEAHDKEIEALIAAQ